MLLLDVVIERVNGIAILEVLFGYIAFVNIIKGRGENETEIAI